MSEVEINGHNEGVDLDLTLTKAALTSSSTNLRLGQLKLIEERLSKKGTQMHKLPRNALACV